MPAEGAGEALRRGAEPWPTTCGGSGAGEPILARPVGGVERAWRWCRRNPALAALASCVVLLLLVVGIGAPMAVISLSRQRDQARRAELEVVDKLWQSYLAQGPC